MTVTHNMLKQLEDRVIRIESRLVQIMFHLGMNPYEKQYDAPITQRKPDEQGKEFS